ncbi:hypothetical protein SARC_12684 [Sphaeroforma arctica JP610]|uniref:Uncharacterized protein n=1 Tax=Sphaeroforma arctica JP610 TaxID=667725 RepID=A0A0L0FFF8_9EUKA|nr:hypothetical protein SARC_12684 [Sphaeroforma arctica JP610]KNC74778.1 hypothetical protein SARC_12684 [Sphaeroforma arctica JP610]|eukprot:XP_014148680.1 hypothetical protein SARC_12684 [Sphaeroforma arctica JP610]
MGSLLSADPMVIYPKEVVFLRYGQESMPAPDFVALVYHMSPYRPQKLRKDFWEKLEADLFEKLAVAAVKREDEVVSCMVQEDTVGAVTHPSWKGVRCGLPAEEAGVETTPISVVGAFSSQSWRDISEVLDQSVRKKQKPN